MFISLAPGEYVVPADIAGGMIFYFTYVPLDERTSNTASKLQACLFL